MWYLDRQNAIHVGGSEGGTAVSPDKERSLGTVRTRGEAGGMPKGQGEEE